MNLERLRELAKKKKKIELSLEEITEYELLLSKFEYFIENENLNPIEIETFIKRYREGKTWDKVADETFDMSTDTPRKRIHRALARLKH